MSGPETTQDLATHLRRMADSAVDQIDAGRLSIAANLVERAHLVTPAAPPDGGPAYPVMWDYAEGETGMSLRDYFAGQALVGILAGGFADTIPHDDVNGGGGASFFAYQYADAMIAARGGE